jgi:uncharacterized membrane protein YgcG
MMWLTGMVVVTVTALGLAAMPAHAADIEVNGCGAASGISRYIVPNNPLGFPFEDSCNKHDYCYGAGLDKGYCDNQFYANLRAVCDGNVICNGLAWSYYLAVNRAAGSAWDESAQARLNGLINDILRCGADSGCAAHAVDDFDFDTLVQQLQACQGDSSCERAISEKFGGESPAPDPPAADPGESGSDDHATQADPGDPGSDNPGTGENAGDSGDFGGGDFDGGGFDGGDSGGGSSSGGPHTPHLETDA